MTICVAFNSAGTLKRAYSAVMVDAAYGTTACGVSRCGGRRGTSAGLRAVVIGYA